MKSDWQTKKLGELCDVLDSRRKPVTQRDRVSGEYPYYGATGIQDYVNNYIFDEKLILIGEDGAKWGAGENTAFIADGKYWVNNHAHVIRPHRDTVLDNWIVYFLNVNDLSKHITGLTVQKLNQAKMREIEIPLPELGEQKRIVKKLDEVFENVTKAKEAAERNLQNSKDLFESYLQSVFANPGKDWEEKKLSELYQIGSSKRVLKSQWRKEGVPFYRGREITRLATDGYVKNELFISEDHYQRLLKQSGVPKSGDIVITAIGTIGNMHIVRGNDKFYFKDASVLWMKKVTDTNSEFVKFWLKSALFFDQLDRGNGATVDTLTIKKLQSVKLCLPTLGEQQDIVKKFNTLSVETKKLEKIYEQKLADLEELKKSILSKAFHAEL